MYKKDVALRIKQTVNYTNMQDADTWELTSVGELIQLKSYTRLKYLDKDGVEITIKWKKNHLYEGYSVSIEQPHYVLHFNPYETTYTHYATPQGNWQLTVLTHEIILEEGKQETKLLINYQMLTQNNLLGEYQFQLKY